MIRCLCGMHGTLFKSRGGLVKCTREPSISQNITWLWQSVEIGLKEIKSEIESRKRAYSKLETEAKHLENQYDKKVEKANSTGKLKYLSEGLALKKTADQNRAEMKVIQDDIADFEPKNIYNVTKKEFLELPLKILHHLLFRA